MIVIRNDQDKRKYLITAIEIQIKSDEEFLDQEEDQLLFFNGEMIVARIPFDHENLEALKGYTFRDILTIMRNNTHEALEFIIQGINGDIIG